MKRNWLQTLIGTVRVRQAALGRSGATVDIGQFSAASPVSARLPNLIAALVAVSSILFCALGVVRSYSPVPLPDDWIGVYEFALNAHDGDVEAWWRPYLENRPVLPRILFWLDVTQFGGSQIFLVVVNCLLAGLVWAILVIFIRLRTERENVFFVSCLSLAGMFAWMQGSNLYTGFAGSLWFMAMLFPLAAFYCLYRSINSRLWFAFAAALGVASVWTMAIGILALPVMILSSIAIDLGWRRTSVLAVLFALCVAAYFWNLSLPANLGYRPGSTLLFTLTFLGGPAFWSALSWIAGVSHLLAVIAGEKGLFAIGDTFQEFAAAVVAAQILATIAGAVFAVAAIVLISRELKSSRVNPLQRCLLGFVAFSGLAAMAIALGRVHSGIGHLNQENYQTATLLAWQVLAIATVKPKFDLGRCATLAIALAVALMPSELRALKPHQIEYERLTNALRGVQNGAASQEQVSALGGPGVVPVVLRLEKRGIRLIH